MNALIGLGETEHYQGFVVMARVTGTGGLPGSGGQVKEFLYLQGTYRRHGGTKAGDFNGPHNGNDGRAG